MQHHGVKGARNSPVRSSTPQLVDRGATSSASTQPPDPGCVAVNPSAWVRCSSPRLRTQTSRSDGPRRDQQLKPVAELAHLPPAALKGGHCDGLDLVSPSPSRPGANPAIREWPVPLIEQTPAWAPGKELARAKRVIAAIAVVFCPSRGQDSHSATVSHRPRSALPPVRRRSVAGGRQIVPGPPPRPRIGHRAAKFSQHR